jgi:hypothetical protein
MLVSFFPCQKGSYDERLTLLLSFREGFIKLEPSVFELW